MGRNSATTIQWAHTHDGTSHVILYYCQQHMKWDRITNTTLATAFAPLKLHFETDHGNVEQ